MKGEAFAHGAATIVNAIATGKGAAFGIGLKTWAEVEIVHGDGVVAEIEGFGHEDTTLIRKCVEAVLARYFPRKGLGAKVRTRSEIPISRGLKSSSAAANAVIFATLRAIGAEYESLEAIKIGTKCAIESGVSITGALDDACASFYGGVVITDNNKGTIIKRDSMPDGLKVLIHVPDFQIRKNRLPLDSIRSIRNIVELAYERALAGDYFTAMTLNGLAYGAALNIGQEIAIRALSKGAKAAGLSGTGPATVILIEEEQLDDFLGDFEDVKFIVTDIYNGELHTQEKGDQR
ncbi:MAG: shikimate kinase [Methanomassiliicoccales archaeon]|jgi:shikimate kinase|nr:shikimate kinase [Methanomassiliicoccales archaeon]